MSRQRCTRAAARTWRRARSCSPRCCAVAPGTGGDHRRVRPAGPGAGGPGRPAGASTRAQPNWARSRSGVLVLRAGVLPVVLRRALRRSRRDPRETQPLVNVAASLLAAAALTLLAYAVSRPLVALAPSPATHAIPVGIAVVLIGFFVLVTRRRALSQLVGFLLMDNGITAVGVPHHGRRGAGRRARRLAGRAAGRAGAAGPQDPDAGRLRRHRPRRAAGAARLMTTLLLLAPLLIPLVARGCRRRASLRLARRPRWVGAVSAVGAMLGQRGRASRSASTGGRAAAPRSAGCCAADALSAFMLIVIGARRADRDRVASPGLPGGRARRRPHRPPGCAAVRRAGAAVPGRDGAGGAGREPRRAVGGDRGDHHRHRVPGRPSPRPRRRWRPPGSTW